MNLKLKAFASHENSSTVISPRQPKEIVLNNETIIKKWDTKDKNGIYYIKIQFSHRSSEDMIEIRF